MAESSGPFDVNPGQPGIWSQDQWYDFAPLWAPSGVVGTAGTSTGTGDLPLTVNGLTVSLGTGRAWVRGAGYENDAAKAFAVTANGNATLARRDRIVLRRDLAAKTVTAIRLQGTPAASPVAPALTQVAGGVWDQPLFSFLVPANNGTTLSGFVDERVWLDALGGGTTISGKMWRTAGPSGDISTDIGLRVAMEASRVAGGFVFSDQFNILTVPFDGFYDLAACAYWFGTGTWSSTAWIQRTRSGAVRPIVGGEAVNKTTSKDTRQYFSNRLPLQGGDQLELVVYGYTAGGQYYGVDEVNTCWLSATYAGPLNGAAPV